MKLSMLVMIIGAALLTVAPFSLQWTPRKVGLYIDKADARVVHRSVYRRSYYGYGYGGAYYSAGCPRLFGYGYPAPYYGYPPYPCYWDRPYALWSGWR
jgi:hypothetical protein